MFAFTLNELFIKVREDSDKVTAGFVWGEGARVSVSRLPGG